MHLHLDRAQPFSRGDTDGRTDLSTALDLDYAPRADGSAVSGSITNTSDAPVAVRAVGLVIPVSVEGDRPARMFSNGYQSWTGTGVLTLGVDSDPSLFEDAPESFRAVHHADQGTARPGELRSELVTVLADDVGVICLGASGGDRHDTTFRFRPAAGGTPTDAELVVEAFLGGAELAPGATVTLHDVTIEHGEPGSHSGLLDRWAAICGDASGARVTSPFQVGWCSWYHYFEHITEDALRANLALASDWPFEVFQLDDGFQSAIGDWLTTNDRFGDLAAVAAEIAAAGRRPGLWLAPFVVAPHSELARAHPEWAARTLEDDAPLPGWLNEAWGGVVDVLDTTRPEVQDHLEHLARELVGMGFTYLKLDFTFAPSIDGHYHDRSLTPAQRVRAGYDAIRRGAGEDAFILGCGAPLGHCIGVVDGMRIGADVAPSWDHDWTFPAGYLETIPATVNSYQDTVTRAFMHRRLWLNDPDCLMLRTDETQMSSDAVRAWALTVAASGGMALVSDDLSLLGDDARALLDEVIRIGRRVDQAAIGGSAPACPDLMDARLPTTLVSDAFRLEVDPSAPVVRVAIASRAR